MHYYDYRFFFFFFLISKCCHSFVLGKFGPQTWCFPNYLKFCAVVHSYVLITILVFYFLEIFFSIQFFLQISSENLRLSKWTKSLHDCIKIVWTKSEYIVICWLRFWHCFSTCFYPILWIRSRNPLFSKMTQLYHRGSFPFLITIFAFAFFQFFSFHNFWQIWSLNTMSKTWVKFSMGYVGICWLRFL